MLTLNEDAQGSVWIADDVLLLYSAFDDPYTAGSVIRVSFSKVTNTIYFSAVPSTSPGTGDLWALHLDDEFDPILLQALTQTPEMDEYSVSGSADDTKIAYGLYVDGVSSVVVVANSDGSDPVVMPRPAINKKGMLESQRMPAFKR
jgi:hypothetical protein